MADLQLQQQAPVLRPVLTAWPATRSNMKERSTWALVQLYPRRFLKNGILWCGQADQCCGTLEQLILPSSLPPDVPREVGDYISSCERCTAVPCFRKKEKDRKGKKSLNGHSPKHIQYTQLHINPESFFQHSAPRTRGAQRLHQEQT